MSDRQKNWLITAAIIAALIAVFVFIYPADASAQTTSGSSSQAGSYSGVNITSGNGHKGVGNAIAPGLIASGLSCAGSTSAAVGFMGGAVSFGLTTMDKDCNSRENAKMFGIMGDKEMATEILCDSKQVLEADRRLGRGVCSKNRGRVREARVDTFVTNSTAGYATSAKTGRNTLVKSQRQ